MKNIVLSLLVLSYESFALESKEAQFDESFSKDYGLRPVMAAGNIDSQWGIVANTFWGRGLPDPNSYNAVVLGAGCGDCLFCIVISEDGDTHFAELYRHPPSGDKMLGDNSQNKTALLKKISITSSLYKAIRALIYYEANGASCSYGSYGFDGMSYYFGARDCFDKKWSFAETWSPQKGSRAYKFSKLALAFADLFDRESDIEKACVELEKYCAELQFIKIEKKSSWSDTLDVVLADLNKTVASRNKFTALKQEIEKFGKHSSLCNALPEFLRDKSRTDTTSFCHLKTNALKKNFEYYIPQFGYSMLASLRSPNMHSCDGFWAVLPYSFDGDSEVFAVLTIPNQGQPFEVKFGKLLAVREIASGVYLSIVSNSRE